MILKVTQTCIALWFIFFVPPVSHESMRMASFLFGPKCRVWCLFGGAQSIKHKPPVKTQDLCKFPNCDTQIPPASLWRSQDSGQKQLLTLSSHLDRKQDGHILFYNNLQKNLCNGILIDRIDVYGITEKKLSITPTCTPASWICIMAWAHAW